MCVVRSMRGIEGEQKTEKSSGKSVGVASSEHEIMNQGSAEGVGRRPPNASEQQYRIVFGALFGVRWKHVKTFKLNGRTGIEKCETNLSNLI